MSAGADLAEVVALHRRSELGALGPGPPPEDAGRPPEAREDERLWRPPSPSRFGERAPPRALLEDVLARAYGDLGGRRNVASAGALYALRIDALERGEAPAVLALAPAGGLRHSHRCEEDLDAALFHAVQGRPWIVVVSADLGPYARRYAARGYRYALLEAGAVCHAIASECARRALATRVYGSFHDAALRRALAQELTDLAPLVVVAVGTPAATAP